MLRKQKYPDLTKIQIPDEAFRGAVVKKGGVLFVSSTTFQEFMTCPMRGYYSKIKKLKSLGPTPAALLFGTAVHGAMEKYMRTRQRPNFLDYWRDFVSVDMGYTEQEVDFPTLSMKGQAELDCMIDAAEEAGVGAAYPIEDSDEMAIEKHDKYALSPNLVLTRTFDAIAPVQGVPTVIDWKTSGRVYTVGLQDCVSEQLTSYLFPHSLKGVPQPEQAMFVVGTKTKSPVGMALVARREPARFMDFRRDAYAVYQMIIRKQYFHVRSWSTCGNVDHPMCQFYALCYKTPGWEGMYAKIGATGPAFELLDGEE